MSLLWRPTLAATLPADADLSALPYPIFASPKIDGVRAMVQNSRVVTRNGLEIRNEGVQALFGREEYEGLDGELCVGSPTMKDVFNATVRVVMNGSQERAALVRLVGNVLFCIFDVFSTKSDFMRRTAAFQEIYGKRRREFYVVPQKLVINAAALSAYEEKCLAQGYEGVMLRSSIAGPYMQKRSTLKEFSLVKLKRWDYGRARIMQRFDLLHNENEDCVTNGRRSSKKAGMVADGTRTGSVRLVDVKSGVEFDVKVSTDRLQGWEGWHRQIYWHKKVVRYKFQLCGTMNGVPRFPTATFEELL